MKIQSNEYQVMPDALPGARQKENYSPEQFGAGVYAEAGKNAQRIGIQAGLFKEQADYQKNLERELELSMIDRLYKEQSTEFLYGENGIMHAKQLNAKDLNKRVASGLGGIRQNLLATTKDPEVRMKFEHSSGNFQTRAVGNAFIKEGEQLEFAKQADRKVRLESGANQIGLLAKYGDEDGLGLVTESLNNYIRDIGTAEGMSDDQILNAQQEFVGQSYNLAIDNLSKTGHLEEAKALYKKVGPIVGFKYLNDWDKSFYTLDAQHDKEVLRMQKEASKAAEEAAWNAFVFSETPEERAAAMSQAKALGDGDGYLKMVNREKQILAGVDRSDEDTWDNFSEMVIRGRLTKEMVNTAFSNGHLSQTDSRTLKKTIDSQSKEEWSENDKLGTEMAKNYILTNITNKDEQRQALTLVLRAGKKGDDIFKESQRIVDTKAYKTGRSGVLGRFTPEWLGGSNPIGYNNVEQEVVETSSYSEKYGRDNVQELKKLAGGDWQTTKQILDSVGGQAGDPALGGIIRKFKGNGAGFRNLTVDEFSKMVLEVRYQVDQLKPEESDR